MKIKLRTIFAGLSVLAAFSMTLYAYCGCKDKKQSETPKCCHTPSEKPSSQQCPNNGDCCLKDVPPVAPANSQTSQADNFFIAFNPAFSQSADLNISLIAEGDSTGPPIKSHNDKLAILCVFVI